MRKLRSQSKYYLLAFCFSLLVSLAGCSDDDTATSSNPLPQPSVDCGGSSCVD